MRVGLYYDQKFKARFGADSVNAMRRALASVKLFWSIKKNQVTYVLYMYTLWFETFVIQAGNIISTELECS